MNRIELLIKEKGYNMTSFAEKMNTTRQNLYAILKSPSYPTLEKVAELRNQVAAATSPAEAMRASDELTRQVSGIFAVAESYPDLKASANFSQLQEELTNTENKIAYSRQLYNSVTSNYNVKLETFPSNVIAKMFSFKSAEFLETPEEEKAVPKVDFSGLGN